MAGSGVKVARVYLRVSTDDQDLTRQDNIVAGARAAGFYVAAVYREKASGARPDRPELLRMVADLQPGEVVVAEKIDRISRLPLPEAELLVETIRGRGARLAVPGIVDLSDLVADSAGVARIVLEAVQDMLLRVALQTARERTLALIADVDDDDLHRPLHPIMSPLVWDLGHIAAYEDLWAVHRLGDEPLLHPELAALYDAFETPRAVRGDLPILDREAALEYLDEVRERTLGVLARTGASELHELVLREMPQEPLADAVEVRRAGGGEQFGALLGQHRVAAAAVVGAEVALEQLLLGEPVDEPRHARPRQQHGVGQLGHPALAPGRGLQRDQDLVGRQREVMRSRQLRVERLDQGRVDAQQAAPRSKLLSREVDTGVGRCHSTHTSGR